MAMTRVYLPDQLYDKINLQDPRLSVSGILQVGEVAGVELAASLFRVLCGRDYAHLKT